jgi:hypothetical protein
VGMDYMPAQVDVIREGGLKCGGDGEL